MNLILLGGNGVDNKDWIEEIELILKPYFKSTQIQYYDHWKSGTELINLNKEVDKLIKNINLKAKYIIFAKSVGSLVATKAIFDEKILPIKCFFVGVPVHWAYKHNFDINKWFKNLKVPLTIIQHTNDPITSAKELKIFLKAEGVINYNLVEWPGNDHFYKELDRIKTFVINTAK